MLKQSISWQIMVKLRVLFTLAMLATAGCQSTGPEQVDTAPIIPPVKEQQVKPQKPPPPIPLAIVVSANVPVYLDVENALTKQLSQPFEVFNLDESSAEEILARLQSEKVISIVAIGDPALKLASRHHPETKIVYSQIFNPLPSEYRGVAAIPPMALQLKYWQSLNSDLHHVGVVSSKDFEPVVQKLVEAGKSLGIQIVNREVSSDKAALHEFRRLIPVVEGFIILPDASILSPGVLRRMVQHANANSVELLSYNLPIFNLGAYMHVTSAYADIAGRIMDLLENEKLGNQDLKIVRIKVRGAELYVDLHG